MSDNTGIFIMYDKHKMGFQVAHVEEHLAAEDKTWKDSELFRLESAALKNAVQIYINLQQDFRPPEYGIVPLYDPKNLLSRFQTTLIQYGIDINE